MVLLLLYYVLRVSRILRCLFLHQEGVRGNYVFFLENIEVLQLLLQLLLLFLLVPLIFHILALGIVPWVALGICPCPYSIDRKTIRATVFLRILPWSFGFVICPIDLVIANILEIACVRRMHHGAASFALFVLWVASPCFVVIAIRSE